MISFWWRLGNGTICGLFRRGYDKWSHVKAFYGEEDKDVECILIRTKGIRQASHVVTSYREMRIKRFHREDKDNKCKWIKAPVRLGFLWFALVLPKPVCVQTGLHANGFAKRFANRFATLFVFHFFVLGQCVRRRSFFFLSDKMRFCY